MKALNLGCGQRFVRDWTNVDFVSTAMGVQACDLTEGIPFEDATFDVVYHSHLVEHFSKQAAPAFLRECHRVLRPGGIIRVAAPDLERIARVYVEALEKACRGDREWRDNYEWITLEMYDQAVRESPGGAAIEYFKQDPIPNWGFVQKRWGAEAQNAIKTAQAVQDQSADSRARQWVHRIRNSPSLFRTALLKSLLGKDDYEALQVGRFRRSGEVHKWMYDAYSLTQLLQQVGFLNAHGVGPTESQIPGWVDYHLDTEPDGTVYKPDSFYVEAVKP